MSKNSEIKNAVRKTKEWKEFRKHLIEKQKIDPITKNKLTKGCNVHHMDLNVEHYGNLIDENFVVLNRNSHDLIHRLFGHERHINSDWRERLDAIRVILEKMEMLNKQKKEVGR